MYVLFLDRSFSALFKYKPFV